MRISGIAVYCLMICLTVPHVLRGQTTRHEHESLRSLVQGFYDWYVPEAVSDTSVPTWNLALKTKASAFSPELAQLLQADCAAQAKCEELVGLDFDPFLNTQDPAEQYEVGGISQEGRYYRADIYSVQSGKRSEKPDVRAEFSENDGHWFFVNFYYPDGTNLLTILKSPRPKCSTPRPRDKK